MKPPLNALSNAILAFARGLHLRRGAEFRVSLTREEAPQLWEQIEVFSRDLGVSAPREVFLESGVGAWVQLLGVAAGQGKSKLGVGFDLLVGLSPAQARAVMAHEIAHAKHVRRGYHGFLMKGLARLHRCSASLQWLAGDTRQPKFARKLSKALGALPEKIGDVAGRLVAACSRYDEFLADRIAAQVCGSKPCREALLATHVLDHQSDKLSWRERLLHLDRAPGYTAWLIEKLNVSDDERRLEIEARALEHAQRHEMSTHPALPDRLAALDELASESEITLPNEPKSAIFWLRDPDATAAKLLREIERIAALEEAKATKSLSKWMKKQLRTYGARSRKNQGWALGALMVGALFFVVNFSSGLERGWEPSTLFCTFFYFGAMVAGSVLLLMPRRPQVEFPIPSFGSYCGALNQGRQENRAWREEVHAEKELTQNERIASDVARTQCDEGRNIQLGATLRAQLPAEIVKPRAIAHFWNSKGAEFLRECDHRSAMGCARLALESDQKSPDALFLHALCGSFENRNAVRAPIQIAFAARADFSARWMMAWANCLWGETGVGEAFLLDLTRQNSDNAMLWGMLAHCQSRNDKPREALISYRRALELVQSSERESDADAHRFVLAQSLAGFGMMTEARAEFDLLDSTRRERPLFGVDELRLDIELLRWDLSNEDVSQALERAENFAAQHQEPHHLLQLADTLIESPQGAAQEAARALYERALQSGFYPQAWLALSKIAFDARDKIQAQQLILRSLDTTQTRPLDAIHPLSQLKEALAGLRVLRDAVPRQVSAFEVDFDAKDTTLKVDTVSLWCLFATAEEAREAATTIFAALWPEHDLDGRISHELAPKESQPTDMIAPGIYNARWK